jgi:undecaprenyl-diphosphatase
MIPAIGPKTSLLSLSLLQQIDLALFNKVFGYGKARQALTQTALAVSKSGDGYAQLVSPLLVWLSGSILAPTYALALAVAFSVERFSYYILKNSLKRLRPCDLTPSIHSLITASDKFSFPSGHTSAAFCLCVMTSLMFGGVSAVLFIWAAAVGLSRVIVGVHFPGDIVAGALLGSGVALVTASTLNLW